MMELYEGRPEQIANWLHEFADHWQMVPNHAIRDAERCIRKQMLELAQWQKYADYCQCSAHDGDQPVLNFDEFISQEVLQDAAV